MFALLLIIANFPLDWIVLTPKMKKQVKMNEHPYLFCMLVPMNEFVLNHEQSLLSLLVHGAPLVHGHEAFGY